jgi:DNA-binding transcriptional regulator YbjK
MTSIRTRALDAAVAIVGSEGLRALSHARVDDRAGLPKGSTSNYFRTRAALLDGLSAHIALQEIGNFDPTLDLSRASVDEVIDALCALIEAQTTTHRLRTVARYAMFLASTQDDELRAPLLANRHAFEGWMVALLTGLGAHSPEEHARTVMACAEGLVMHRISIDAELPVRPTIETVLRACLA